MISLKSVSKRFDEHTVLDDVSLELSAGKTHVILGSSGCGKSTLLRIILGLIEPSSGEVVIDGEPMGPDTQRSLTKKMGYVVQDAGLFPHLKARENIALPAQLDGRTEEWISERIEELGQLVGLYREVLERFPSQLSGGQKQRVGLIRALMLKPKIMLLDEPLGALDPIIRREVQEELRELMNRLQKTAVMVTHDIGEAAYFGHTVTMLDEGRLIQHGTFDNFLNNPATSFVTRFINSQRVFLDSGTSP